MSAPYEVPKRGTPGIVEFPGSVELLPNGHILIADGGDELGFGSEVVEVDLLGNVVWTYHEGLSFVHTARPTRRGTILITDTTNDRLLEITYDKKILMDSTKWTNNTGRLSDGSHLSYPNDAYELNDDELLVTDRNNDRVLIVDRHGNVKWEYDKDILHPHNAHPTQKGTILICDSDHDRIIEVNLKKEIIWSYGDNPKQQLKWPRHTIRLSNGNTIITDSKNARVIEVTPNGEIVWSWKVEYFAKFYETKILPNGNFLISDQQHHQVLEIDRAGNVVWLFRNYRTIGPIFDKLINGSFKEVDGDVPKGWFLAKRHSEGGGRLIWDTNHKPYPCPGLDFDRDGMLYLGQLVSVKPGKFYTLAGDVKTEDVRGAASLMMCFLDSYGGQIFDITDIPQTDPFIGTHDWTSTYVEAPAPKNATCVEIRFYISGPGKAWIKNVMFHEG